ncbi:MAG: leucine-rich repeat domain-containing protein, partial [Lachnospiraceae bacterium]|nr:leucine-rich repeat domain-containing protein [Lachnospiraceae bacterium]
MIHKTISFFLPLAAVLLVLAVLTVTRIPSENNDEESDRLYLFEEAEDGGSYILAKVRDRSVTAAVIPGLYHGLPVTEIGEGAFSYCKMLTDVCFPNTVRKIGENAFQYCTGLKEADLPEGLAEIGDQAFFHCYALERVVIPDGVCRIGENAFYNCTALAEILIPDSVSEIGYGALQTGSMFQKVRLSGGMRAQRCLYLHVFYDVDKPPQLEERSVFGSYWPSCADLVIVPEGVESIEASFLENSMINRIMLPSSLKRIDARCYSEGLYKPIEKVFYKGTEADFSEIEGALSGDQVIYFYAESKPDSAGYYWHEKNGEPVVWSSGDEKLRFTLTDEGSGYRVAAYPADCLGDLVIPDEYNGLPVVEIAPLGFIGHDDLTGISFPDTLQKIGRAAFAGCDNLTEIVIPEGVTELGALSISYCRRIEYIYIPGTVNHIPGYLICSDGNLKSVEMGDGIRSIGQYSIYEGRKLEKIRFSDSIQELRSPLRNCPMLADVCLPESLVLLSWPEDSGTFMRYLRIPDQVTDISLMGADTSGWSRTFVVPEGLVKSQHRFTNGDRIYFKGSEEVWNQSVGIWPDDDIYTYIHGKKLIWFYSDNPPESPGFYWYEENGFPKEWRYDEDSLVFTLTEDGSGYSVRTIP